MATAPPPYPHPERPEITVLDDTPVPYDALPMAGDGVFEGNLTVRYHSTLPSAHVFRRVSVDVDALYHQENDLETLPFYEALVEQQEPGAAHRLKTIKKHIATLDAGGTLSPIVISVDWGWTKGMDKRPRRISPGRVG